MSSASRATKLPPPSAAASSLACAIQARLAASASPATKAWMENYVKSSSWRGNKSPVVRAAVQDAVRAAGETDARSVTGRALYDGAFSLLGSTFADDKLAGMILFKEFALEDPSCRSDVLYPARGDGPAKVLADVRRLFDDDSPTGVNEWSTCDWLCLKVLGPYVAGVRPREARRAAARSLMAWSSPRDPVAPVAPASVWCRRAGHVAFVSHIVDKNKNKSTSTSKKAKAKVNVTKKRKYGEGDERERDGEKAGRESAGGRSDDDDATGGDELFGEGWLLELIAACDAALASRERFAQTGAGWVLRYCLLQRRKEVVEVLKRRGPTMTTEGMRYALERCADAALKKRLMHIVKSGGVPGGAVGKQSL